MSRGPQNGTGRKKRPGEMPGLTPPPGTHTTVEERETFLHNREKQRTALAMWGRKVKFEEIARQLGCSAWTAYHLVRRGLEAMDAPEAKERRAQDNIALDELERILWGTVARPGYVLSQTGRIIFEPYERDEQGRPKPVVNVANRLAASAQLIRLQERRARLNGTDMPIRVDVKDVTLEAALLAVEALEREATRQEAEQALQLPPLRALEG